MICKTAAAPKSGAAAVVRFSQRIILIIVTGKIHGLWARGDPLTGIISKTEAGILLLLHSFFGTEDGAVIQVGAINTVSAGALNFFSEQHRIGSFL